MVTKIVNYIEIKLTRLVALKTELKLFMTEHVMYTMLRQYLNRCNYSMQIQTLVLEDTIDVFRGTEYVTV